MCEICDINNINKVDYTDLLKILASLYGTSIDKIGDVNMTILNWIYQQYLGEFIKNSDDKLNSNLQRNMYNYSVAKSWNFNDELKKIIKSGGELLSMKELSNKFFGTFQAVENAKVKQTSQVIKTFKQPRVKMLEYSATRDNTRPSHLKADGTVLPSNDKWWNRTAFKLLSEWGCNCQIVETDRDRTKVPKIKIAKDTHPASTIDVEEGKYLIFNEELDMFKNTPEVVRRRLFKAEIK